MAFQAASKPSLNQPQSSAGKFLSQFQAVMASFWTVCQIPWKSPSNASHASSAAFTMSFHCASSVFLIWSQ